MPWPKGQTKSKTGGRQLGTPNKRTTLLQDVLQRLECNVPERLIQLLPNLDPKEQAHVLLELLSYLYPRRKAEEVMAPPRALSVDQTRNVFISITSDPEAMKAAQVVAERLVASEQPT